MSDEFKDVSTVSTLTLERSAGSGKAGCCKDRRNRPDG